MKRALVKVRVCARTHAHEYIHKHARTQTRTHAHTHTHTHTHTQTHTHTHTHTHARTRTRTRTRTHARARTTGRYSYKTTLKTYKVDRQMCISTAKSHHVPTYARSSICNVQPETNIAVTPIAADCVDTLVLADSFVLAFINVCNRLDT